MHIKYEVPDNEMNATTAQSLAAWRALDPLYLNEGWGDITLTLYSVAASERLWNDRPFMAGYAGATRPPIGHIEQGRKYSELWGCEGPCECVLTDDNVSVSTWLAIDPDSWEA